jgi:hypothetical protein
LLVRQPLYGGITFFGTICVADNKFCAAADTSATPIQPVQFILGFSLKALNMSEEAFGQMFKSELAGVLKVSVGIFGQLQITTSANATISKRGMKSSVTNIFL